MPAVLDLPGGHLIDGHVHTEVPDVVDNDDSISVTWVYGVLLFEEATESPFGEKTGLELPPSKPLTCIICGLGFDSSVKDLRGI